MFWEVIGITMGILWKEYVGEIIMELDKNE